jgi:hypothetical protein
MGQLDPQRGDYLVTELNAHSWPELYFPGHGWIPFEPTSGQVIPERIESAALPPDWADRIPGELASQLGELRAAATENASEQRRWLAARSISGAASGLLFCLYAAALLWRLTGATRSPIQPGPEGELGAAYDRLLRWGGRLGRPARPADTPREYATALNIAADSIVGRARVLQRGAARAAQTFDNDVSALAAAYEAATYGPEAASLPVAPAVAPRSRARLWTAMWRLWLARLIAPSK